MPATTIKLQLPYPIPADTVDVPRDVQALAEKLDNTIGAAGGASLTSAPVLDVGMTGQIRAGRQLTLADFTSIGLAAPAGLWNLSNLNDSSGNNRALSNKGGVPFGVGINGLASTSAVFAGSTGQALYIADTGASDPFRIKTGSVGCWFRTAKRGVYVAVMGKWPAAAGQNCWLFQLTSLNVMSVLISSTGSDQGVFYGVSDVCDDRWHFAVATHDGSVPKIYIDGVLEGTGSWASPLFGGTAPLNIGGFAADGAIANAGPHYGRVDEAFVTPDVLSDDQIRALYCAKHPARLQHHPHPREPQRPTAEARRAVRGRGLPGAAVEVAQLHGRVARRSGLERGGVDGGRRSGQRCRGRRRGKWRLLVRRDRQLLGHRRRVAVRERRHAPLAPGSRRRRRQPACTL